MEFEIEKERKDMEPKESALSNIKVIKFESARLSLISS